MNLDKWVNIVLASVLAACIGFYSTLFYIGYKEAKVIKKIEETSIIGKVLNKRYDTIGHLFSTEERYSLILDLEDYGERVFHVDGYNLRSLDQIIEVGDLVSIRGVSSKSKDFFVSPDIIGLDSQNLYIKDYQVSKVVDARGIQNFKRARETTRKWSAIDGF